MESGKIPDENIAASSWQEPFHAFRPEEGRLHNDAGVWCPNTLGEADKGYYLQVEFPARYSICAVATQGSPLYDTDWVTKYRLQFSMDGQNFTFYTENGTVKVRHALPSRRDCSLVRGQNSAGGRFSHSSDPEKKRGGGE